jgi:hypothetical protein
MGKRQDFRSFFLSLSDADRERFAARAGASADYIRIHLIAPPQRRKIPRKLLVDKLVRACAEFGASFSKEQLLAYFYETAEGPHA